VTMKKTTGRIATLAALGAWLAPAAAVACPACAAREGPGAAVLGLVGALIAVPYLIAAVTIRVVRRLERGR
jgi:hypothetical protein